MAGGRGLLIPALPIVMGSGGPRGCTVEWRADSACLSYFCAQAGRMQQELSSSPPAAELASLAVVVTGRVQGVGFRFFAHEAARRLRLTGYVRNLRDGSVGAYAEGPRERLREFLRLMREGPGGSRVRDVRATWGGATGHYSTFSIERTL